MHHWTVEEANAALRYVGERVDRLRGRLERLNMPDADDTFAAVRAVSGGGYPDRELATASVELALGIEELEDAGIVVRDLERGLIDFPSMRDGEEVYLCWLRDEPSVSHWHHPDAGFAGRRPL